METRESKDGDGKSQGKDNHNNESYRCDVGRNHYSIGELMNDKGREGGLEG